MEAFAVALVSILFTALLAGLSYFLKKSLDTLEGVRAQMTRHETTD